MKIKSLQMFGFKSFGDKSELHFDRQIAGVVGPNGCGKSNIVDAIRWVMGEQSAKGLRGSEMADVIFNGTATRKKANFAEVSLIFENNQGLAPAPFNECAEIMITRRLYRSGESEYLINKVPARLKDITDLFLGTGSSARAYSIVAQGKIDQIVLAKPEDRRFLLEEAAGIAKYKVRKASAERKMEATQGNLSRIQDIVQELERNARHLERQVEKAEQFRKVQGELRRLDEQIVSAKIAKLDRQSSQNESLRTEARQNFEVEAKDLAVLETEIEQARLEALNQEKISASDYDRLLKLKERFAQIDKESELRLQRISNLKNQIAEREKDIERLKSKTEANRDVVQQIQAERERLLAERVTEEAIVEGLKSNLQQVDAALATFEKELGEIRNEMDQRREARIREENRREMLRSDRVSLELRRAELERKNDELLEKQKALTASSFASAVELEEKEAAKMLQESSLKALEENAQNLHQEQRELLRQQSEIREALGRCEAELKALESLEQHEVGYQAGSLERRKRTEKPLVMDLVRFKPEYSKVAEAFLYAYGQDFCDADLTAEDLTQSRWARLSGTSEVTFSRSLFDLVEGDVPESLALVFKSIEILDVLPEQGIPTHTQIDLTGRMRGPLGAGSFRETLGEVRKKDTPFGRKMEEQDLLARIQSHREQMVVLEERGREIETLFRDGKASLERVKLEIRESISQLQTIRSRMASEAAQAEGVQRRLQDLTAEIQQLDTKLADIASQLMAAEVSLDLTDLEKQWATHQEAYQLKKAAKVELDSQWIEKRIAFGALVERLERLEQQTIDQEMTRSEYEHNQSLYQSDVQNWTQDIAKEEALILALNQEKLETEGQISGLESGLAESRDRLNTIRSKVEQDEVARKSLQTRKEESQTKLQDLELEHQRLKFEVEELAQLVQERYHVSLQDILANVTPEDLERLEDETVLGSMEVDAVELRAKLEKFGDVNLLALSEFEEIKKRLDFMNVQREDLLKTLDALQSIINRINKITEFRFRETFTAINHNFQILFPKLFGGGRAYMTLTDEKNLLETGVEIFAEPPGKRVQAMSLLSGGEKAMTSISLLFALFAYRPASFCILDEVDAPLDEVNTLRYNQIIEEMSSLSQFIVITHNKKTMQVAEKLFGVTMQEPGVSQLVAVELKEAQAFAS